MAKVNTKDFMNLAIDKWNSTTVREYVKHLNIERFGIPSVTGNVRQENAVISRMKKEYGMEVVKAFVESCVKSYRPNAQYPTVSFMTMYSYMKQYELPKVLKVEQEKSKLQKIKEAHQQQMENVENYF